MNIIDIILLVLSITFLVYILKDFPRFYHENVKDSQIVIRVFDTESLKVAKTSFSSWDVQYTDNSDVIGKIFENLKSASVIRLYIDNKYIQYTAETKKRGQISGSCHRLGYDFFEFGIRTSGHRFDIYGEDRKNPTIKAFYDWWEGLVKPYEEEFDKDFNL